MPPRWPRKPDRNDPAYRRLEDRINFALHVATFLAINSTLWFFQLLLHPWERVVVFTGIWLTALVGHGLYVFAIADYSGSSAYAATSPPTTAIPQVQPSETSAEAPEASTPEQSEP